MTDVLVSLVTLNDEACLKACLKSVTGQSHSARIRIFDNASKDRTREIARCFDVEIHTSERNVGYSAGHNFNLKKGDFDCALLLNSDVILDSLHIEKLVQAMDRVKEAGMVGGKLYRMNAAGNQVLRQGLPVLDSTGIYFTPWQRHFDRGSEENDQGQYDRRQLVFGITGAAMMIRWEMYDDLRQGSELLDEDFFAYREDADLSWRAQLRGWKAVYEPTAEALHLRSVLPAQRRQAKAVANYHSVKNRFLMRRKNMDAAVRRKCFPYMWIRDLGILLYVPILERSSFRALLEARRLRQKMNQKRKHIQETRRVSPQEIAQLFSFKPWAQDIDVEE